MTHRCQSKTLSSPDFESTYTNGGVLKGIQDANGVLPGLFGIIVAANGFGSVLS